MSQTVSPSSGKPYGMARVCYTWRLSRATLYRHLQIPATRAAPERPAAA